MLIALFLTLTIAGTALPIAYAHYPPWTIPTYAYVALAPNTVGVGQYTQIVMWLDMYPPTAGGNGGDRWRGFKLDITKPDGSKESLGPFTSGPVGTTWTIYTPDQVGDYTIVFSWPGQKLTNGTGVPRYSINENDTYLGSTSDPVILHVQQNPIASWQEPPLPDYWTRPINVANREWAQLASNWLGGSWLVDNFQRWGQAPSTPHILWTKPIIDGGIPDAAWGGQHGQTTDYESMWGGVMIMNGKLYYNTGMYPDYGYYKVDLRTGEQVWYKNGTDNGIGQLVSDVRYSGLGGAGVYSGQTFARPSFGQVFHYYGLNGEGVVSHLWMTYGSNWYMLDANTGNWVMTLANVPGGTGATDQDGSILRYSYTSSSGRYTCWNVTQSIGPPSPTGTGQQQWEPRQGATIDAVNDSSWWQWGPMGGTSPIGLDDIRPRSGYTMNVTGSTGLPSLSRVLQDSKRVPKMFLHSSFDSASQTFRVAVVRIDEHVAPYSPMPDKSFTQNNNLGFGVTLLWSKTYQYPLSKNITASLGAASYEDGVFTVESKETMQTWGYSLTDGSQLWGPTPSMGSWDMYGVSGNVAYGNIYRCGYAGVLACIDAKTGKLEWTYNATEIGYESPYGNYPLNVGAISDGKVYLYSTEHSPTTPLWRGSFLRCVNATDGTEIFKIQDFVQGFALADGCIVAGNWYDQQIYVYGKGPSATSVTASPEVSVHGSSVLIKGTVTDVSPGAQKIATSRGLTVAAVADAEMQGWMEYLYMQQAYPTSAKGVEVTLDALDPNGNFVHIGTVTSDTSGMFKKAFVPEVSGEYTVIATFAGSGAYASSYAQTAINVDEAPPATAPPEYPQPIDSTWTIVGVGIAIIIAVALAAIWIKRK